MMVLRVGHPGNQTAPPAVSWYNDMRITVLSGLEMLLELSFPCQTAPCRLCPWSLTMPEPEDRLQLFQYVTSREGSLALLV